MIQSQIQERKKLLLMDASSLLIHAHAVYAAVQAITKGEDPGDLGEWIRQEPYYRQAESEIGAMKALVPQVDIVLNGIWSGRNFEFECRNGVSPYKAWEEGVLSEEELAS